MKMHELIAVNDDIKGQSNKTRGELLSTFNTKRHLFQKKVVTFRSNEAGKPAVTESQSDIQETLSEQLKWVGTFITRAIDSGYQIDIGNTIAKADLVCGTLNIKNVPATALLQLEKHVIAMRDLAQAIPTLDPAQGFSVDTAMGKGYFKAREVTKDRTKKGKKVIVLAPATDKHAAQVVLEPIDEVVGSILEQEWSALTTPAVKSQILNNCDTLLQEVKKARSRANSQELSTEGSKIGQQVIDYVFAPLA